MKLHSTKTFFLAGTIQGSRSGDDEIDQLYREQLRGIILRHCPDADVFCPLRALGAMLAPIAARARADHSTLGPDQIVVHEAMSEALTRLTDSFVGLCRQAARVDVLVAYLPQQEASMGTAMEMWNAFNAGVTVITISPMRQNLALLSTSTIIVPSMEEFERLLEQRWLDRSTETEPRPAHSVTASQPEEAR